MRFWLVEKVGSGFEDAEEWPERGGLGLVVGFWLLVLVLVLVVVLIVELVAILVAVLVVKSLLGITGAVGDDVRDVVVSVVYALIRCGGRETGRCNNKKEH